MLTAIAYFQPITRGELSQLFGKEVSRDVIGELRALNLFAAGPRSPQLGAVSTKHLLPHFGFETLRDLPDMEQLEDAGLLSKQKLLAGALLGDLGERPDLIDREDEGQDDLGTDDPPLALAAEDL